MTILFVDDEPELIEIMEDYCKDLGVGMVAALNGQQALAVLEKNQVDLIFTDLNMPQMNGLELLQHVRSRAPEMPFIFWSGYWDRRKMEEAKSFGNVDLLDKPFQRGEFSSVIQRWKDAKDPQSR